MRDYPRMTVMRCRKCGKEMLPHNHPPYNRDICADCEYLECLGIHTTKQYNEWLKKHEQGQTNTAFIVISSILLDLIPHVQVAIMGIIPRYNQIMVIEFITRTNRMRSIKT